MRPTPILGLLGLLGLCGSARADPTWPSEIDELEEIMFQLESFRARKFADTVSPCSNEASGPGRLNAAEWLRTAFHDMSTASTYFGTGGLDGSLQYELTSGENLGPGLTTTIEFMGPYISRKSSLSDLLAMGVYASVRSCGGPVVPIRAGRKDATARGSTGVPQPQNSAFTFEQQFDRMGFSKTEMIQVTACGHTLGSVHSEQFGDIVPAGTGVDGQIGLDTTAAAFDNKVVTEYLAGTTTNPLVVGPSVRITKNSDFKVFNSDQNVTVQALADPDTFRSTCRTVLQKMIEVVPPGVTLTDPITPYAVKPVNLQLTLDDGGKSLLFTGFIRLRTTGVADGSIESVTITYKNRQGASSCGAGGCTISATVQGVSQGFDDTFAFFPIEATIPTSTGISSFTVTVNYADGTTMDFDNNGNEYPLQDAILLQHPQSCLLGSSGSLTVTAAVRNNRVSEGAQAFVSYKAPQTNSPVASLKNMTVELVKGDCVGDYTFFTAESTIPGGLAYEAFIDVINGEFSDSFKSGVDFGGTCREFQNPAECGGGGGGQTSSSSSSTSTVSVTKRSTSSGSSAPVTTPSSSTTPTGTPSTTTSTSASVSSSSTTPAETPSTTTSTSASTSSSSTTPAETPSTTTSTSVSSSSTTPPVTPPVTSTSTSSGVSTTTTSSSASPIPSLHHRQTVGGYSLVSCWTEGDGIRALRGSFVGGADMTLETCEEFCSDFTYWGTEYGRECFCGNSLDPSSKEAPLEDCNMVCSGDDTQYCGAGNRLELYSTTAAPTTATPTSTPPPSNTPSHVEAVDDYAFVGCWTERAGPGRALSQRSSSDPDMTNEMCAEFCSDFRYFATEYSHECYCGSSLAADTESAPLEDCRMTCAGDPLSFCGGPDRLELFMNPDVVGGLAQQPAGAGNFSWVGCQTETSGGRAMSAKSTASDDMTNEACAEFCVDYEFFGTEYGRECYCANTIAAGSEEAAAGDCNKLCSGSVVEFCGGPNRLSVYQKKEDAILLLGPS